MPEINIEMLELAFGKLEFNSDTAEDILAATCFDRPRRTDRKAGCSECPTADGMYTPYAELLKLMSRERREYFLDRWFCHTDPRFCCNGARSYALECESERA